MKIATPAELIRMWAAPRRAVASALLFGSQARDCADPRSDWDIQLYVWRPQAFSRFHWLSDLGLGPPVHLAFRRPIWGHGLHLSVAFPQTELDLSIVSARRFAALFGAALLGRHRRAGSRAHRPLRDLALVLRPGWLPLKRCAWIERTLRIAQRDLPAPRLTDAEAAQLAARVEADRRGIAAKLARGELIAAQRLLHREVAEANLQLLQELKLRRGEPADFNGRRLEASSTTTDLELVTVDSRCDRHDLEDALQRAVGHTRRLLAALTRGASS